MKKTIRNGVFETNSSACHAISLKHRDLKPCDIPMNKEGKLMISMGEYDGDMVISGQHDKLAYIVSHIFRDSRGVYYIEDLYNDCYEFDLIEDAMKEYIPNCTGIDAGHIEPDINHQLIGCLEDIVNIWNANSVINFVFDDNVELKIFRD